MGKREKGRGRCRVKEKLRMSDGEKNKEKKAEEERRVTQRKERAELIWSYLHALFCDINDDINVCCPCAKSDGFNFSLSEEVVMSTVKKKIMNKIKILDDMDMCLSAIIV